MEPASPKVADLRRDPRYALHCGVEDNSGGNGEFHIIGRAEEITDQRRRTEAFEGELGGPVYDELVRQTQQHVLDQITWFLRLLGAPRS